MRSSLLLFLLFFLCVDSNNATRSVIFAQGFPCAYDTGQLVRDLYTAYPDFIKTGSLTFLEAALDNQEFQSQRFQVNSEVNPTFFAATDDAWESFLLQANTTFNDLLSAPNDKLLQLLRYNSVVKISGNRIFNREPVVDIPLTTSYFVNGDLLETQYQLFDGYGPINPQSNLNTFVQDNILLMDVDDNFEFRQFATYGLARGTDALTGLGNVNRQAILTAPNLLLCGGSVVVHIVDTIQVPAIAYFPTIEALICASPQFSILCEACTIVGNIDEELGTFRTCTPPGFGGANGLNVGYCGYGENYGNNIQSPPGGLTEGEMRTVFAPVNEAWSRFFFEFHIEKDILFNNTVVLQTILRYFFVRTRFFSDEIENEQQLTTDQVGNIGCGSTLPILRAFVSCLPKPLDTISKIIVDGRNLEGNQRNACSNGLTAATVLVKDLLTCNGVIHGVDNVLVGPAFTVLQSLSLRPNYSFFYQLIIDRKGPSQEIATLIVNQFQTVTISVTVYAPTNAAINATLAYLGLDFQKDLLNPSSFEAQELRRQLVFYTTMINSASTEIGDPRRLEQETCKVRDEQMVESSLLDFNRKPPCNLLSGVISLQQLQIIVQGFRGPLTKRVYIAGDVNAALVIQPNLQASNGDVNGINVLLMPPRLAPSVFFRMQRTPTLTVFTSLTIALGLENELRQYTANVFAPTDGAFIRKYSEEKTTVIVDEQEEEDFTDERLLATVEAVLSQGLLPLAYDTVLYHINFGLRPNSFLQPTNPDFEITRVPYQRLVDEVLFNDRPISTVLTDSTAFREDVSPVAGRNRLDSLGYINVTTCQTELTVKREGSFRLPYTDGTVLSTIFLEGSSSTVEGIKLDNTAGVVPPFSQNGTNGVLNIVDKVLTPPLCDCAIASFEYFGFTNGSGLAYTYTSPTEDPRNTEFQLCDAIPCTYAVPNLNQPTVNPRESRLEIVSIEAIVTWRPSQNCELFCPPLSGWWCLPCSERNTQAIVTINGCAKFQPQCGGSLTVYVNDLGEVFLGIQDYVDAFSFVEGLRVVDPSVVARGFIAIPGIAFKILATYDDECGFAKIYINDLLRGVAIFPGRILSRFFSIRYEFFKTDLITVGCGTHANGTDVLIDKNDADLEDTSSIPITAQANFYNPYVDNQHIQTGVGNSQRFCKWRGTITEVLVYLNVLVFPSTCIYPIPVIESPYLNQTVLDINGTQINEYDLYGDILPDDTLLIEKIRYGTFKSSDSNDDICTRSLCGTCSSSCCCDSSCIDHGDCCSNYEDACAADVSASASSTQTGKGPESQNDQVSEDAGESCERSCGFCLQQCCCSSDCDTFGDCCADYEEMCQNPG